MITISLSVPTPILVVSESCGSSNAVSRFCDPFHHYCSALILFGGAGSSSCWRGDSLDEQPQGERHLEHEHW